MVMFGKFLSQISVISYLLFSENDHNSTKSVSLGVLIKSTVLAIGTRPKPSLCNTLTLFKKGWQMLKMLPHPSPLWSFSPLLRPFQWGTVHCKCSELIYRQTKAFICCFNIKMTILRFFEKCYNHRQLFVKIASNPHI